MKVIGVEALHDACMIGGKHAAYCAAWLAEMRDAALSDDADLLRRYPDARLLDCGTVTLRLAAGGPVLSLRINYPAGVVLITALAPSCRASAK